MFDKSKLLFSTQKVSSAKIIVVYNPCATAGVIKLRFYEDNPNICKLDL